MKKLKQIIAQVKATPGNSPHLTDLLWQLICYSPKMPVRLQQQQLLDEAEHTTLTAHDKHFTRFNLNFNSFKWGSGSRRIMLTHGWGSKAADFMELITALRELPDTEIIAFDAPGNGSSLAELSNLDLFVEAAKAVKTHYGAPDVMIGHSLGGMANVITVNQTGIKPKLLVSITPLIKLRENFEASMSAAEVSPQAQATYINSFEELVQLPVAWYDLDSLYQFDEKQEHLLLYDEEDKIAPYTYLKHFLDKRPFINTKNFIGAGHERIIKSPEVIVEIIDKIGELK